MIAYTIPQAAARIFRDETDVRAWIASGHLIAVRSPIDGQEYIEETHLVDVEHAMRTLPDLAPVKAQPLPIPLLARWLWDHGRPTTERALRDWAETGVLARVDGGGKIGRAHV